MESVGIKKQILFTSRDLRNLIVPLFIEQFLLALVGIVDTFVVSYAGEAEVSGVSLVNSFNTVFIFLSTALGPAEPLSSINTSASGNENWQPGPPVSC